MSTTPREQALTPRLPRRDASAVAANSATGIGVPSSQRRASAHRLMRALSLCPPSCTCAQRVPLYGGRRGGAFGLAGFLWRRYANAASSVTLIGVGVTGLTSLRKLPMSAPYRAAYACLRVTPVPHGPCLDTVFADLHAATGALLAAAAASAHRAAGRAGRGPVADRSLGPGALGHAEPAVPAARRIGARGARPAVARAALGSLVRRRYRQLTVKRAGISMPPLRAASA